VLAWDAAEAEPQRHHSHRPRCAALLALSLI
jgi:hypothetical protein